MFRSGEKSCLPLKTDPPADVNHEIPRCDLDTASKMHSFLLVAQPDPHLVINLARREIEQSARVRGISRSSSQLGISWLPTTLRWLYRGSPSSLIAHIVAFARPRVISGAKLDATNMHTHNRCNDLCKKEIYRQTITHARNWTTMFWNIYIRTWRLILSLDKYLTISLQKKKLILNWIIYRTIEIFLHKKVDIKIQKSILKKLLVMWMNFFHSE